MCDKEIKIPFWKGKKMNTKAIKKRGSKIFVLLLQVVVEGNIGTYTETVGVDNYYLLYEVNVTAYNDLGQGPSSPVAEIYSAEDCRFEHCKMSFFPISVIWGFFYLSSVSFF